MKQETASTIVELPLGDPRDPSGQKARPRLDLPEASGADSLRLSIEGSRGLQVIEVQTELALPCATGEAVSFRGASAVHEGNGVWFAVIPGLLSGRHAFGGIRAAAVVSFYLLVLAVERQKFLSAQAGETSPESLAAVVNPGA